MLKRKLKLIGYVRTGDTPVSEIDQVNAILDYCIINQYEVVALLKEHGRPSIGMAQAFELLKKADGLITYDIMRLAGNTSDTFRELRPLIENTFMHGHKKIITISDGFENVTPKGQEVLMNVLNDWSRRGEFPTATYNPETHQSYSVNQNNI